MKTIIETLATARQIAKEGRTYVEDCNATIARDDTYFYAQKHDYVMSSVRRKTFRAIWNYLYQQ